MDPYFLHELALELRMPVGELTQRMSAKELTIDWPEFFAARRRLAEREAREEERRAQRVTGRS